MFNLYINYIHIPFYIVCCWKTGRHIFSFHKTARDARDTDFFCEVFGLRQFGIHPLKALPSSQCW